MDVKILVASHKRYWVPKDPVYLPIHAGAAGKEPLGMLRDDTGEHISDKNPNFCELTAVYWAWKNLDADYLGLVHYRRYFTRRQAFRTAERKKQVLGTADWERLLAAHPVVVPDKRKHYIESNRQHYYHAHHHEGLDGAEAILRERYPDYLPAFEKVMGRTWAHLFNMFVMRRDFFDDYCAWLFDILFELEQRVDISGYSPYEARIFGFVSERLLDVWLEQNKVNYGEQNVTFLEHQNWLKKGSSFVKRKFFPNY